MDNVMSHMYSQRFRDVTSNRLNVTTNANQYRYGGGSPNKKPNLVSFIGRKAAAVNGTHLGPLADERRRLRRHRRPTVEQTER
ncbi:hypothetical protein EVAR_54473_1 [Eumeta japonica]|uniref:Uncharacterized protein n=1 Tax=Eumeta variegata TaxID=151549 RepID=A0A4C1YVV5_EUMVA|nr:hypothetical protein EVAR_54473_1 [Eumeta japonica]